MQDSEQIEHFCLAHLHELDVALGLRSVTAIMFHPVKKITVMSERRETAQGGGMGGGWGRRWESWYNEDDSLSKQFIFSAYFSVRTGHHLCRHQVRKPYSSIVCPSRI